MRPAASAFSVTILIIASTFTFTASVTARPAALVETSRRSLRIPFHLARTGGPAQHRIYVVNVTVLGSPFEVVLDSGSSDLWIDTSGSDLLVDSDVIDTGVPVLLEYGVEEIYSYANGTVQYVAVRLPLASESPGGPRTTEVTAYNQSFVNVPGTTNITQFGNRGILGLGPPIGWSMVRDALAETEWLANTLLETLFDENDLMGEFFTLDFGPRDSTGLVDEGSVIIGDVLPPMSAVLDAPKMPLVTGHFWDVPSRGFIVDGELINLSDAVGETGNTLPFALDSGVYGVLAPPEYLQAIFGSVDGSFPLDDGTWNVPCDAKLNVSISLGDEIFPIHPIDMTEVYAVEDGEALCRSLFQANADESLPFLVGLNALRSMHVLHFYGKPGVSEPYVQAISTVDVAKASAEFDSMNSARIAAFLEPFASSADSDTVSLEAVPVVTSEVSRLGADTQCLWYAQVLLVSTASLAILYSMIRRLCFRGKRNGLLPS